MNDSNIPAKIQLPFANAGTKNTIPVASQIGVTPGAASYTDGFPPLTFTPLTAGGVPPFGADFNGILNALSAMLQWESAGGLFPYDAAFSTAVGGYPKGALLAKSGFNGFWQNLTDGNTSNPDTGGAGWVDAAAGRLINIQVFAAAGTSTYTPTPGTNSVVVHVEGGAGGGAGSSATTSTQITAGSGGAGGAVSDGRITTGFSGVTITVGAAGTAGAAGGNGGAGGASSFGAAIVCAGGGGGGASPAETGAFVNGNGSQAAVTTPGNIGSHKGRVGGYAFAFAATGAGFGISAAGADGLYGTGGVATNAQGNGAAGTGNNAGGAGAVSLPSGAAFSGGAGTPGIVIVYEYS